MARIIFFEKPGCINNTRQKNLLSQAGHAVVAKNLLEHNWSKNELLEYFSGLAVHNWFNLSSPSVKSGKISPEKMTEAEAIEAMLVEPLLIRRPLIKVGNEHKVGFDYREIDEWIGLSGKASSEVDLESCPRNT